MLRISAALEYSADHCQTPVKPTPSFFPFEMYGIAMYNCNFLTGQIGSANFFSKGHFRFSMKISRKKCPQKTTPNEGRTQEFFFFVECRKGHNKSRWSQAIAAPKEIIVFE